jgi:glucuronate isomerase
MPFIHDDFLLTSDIARELYHKHAAHQPIYDYHCHLPPADLAANRRSNNLYELWLEGDHYKWRAMRTNGIEERYCTGDADPYEKFLAFARTVPHTLGNPLYHWTHLELRRYFNTDLLLSEATAPEVWQEANRQITSMNVGTILDRFNVALIGTTDDPADTLEHHQTLQKQSPYDTTIVPAFRPDKAHTMGDITGWNAYIDKLGSAAGMKCNTLDDLLAALEKRHTFFHAMGSRISDHGLTHLPDTTCSDAEASAVFKRARNGEAIPQPDIDRFTMYLMLHFGRLDADAGWVQQLHLGAMRNNNVWALKHLGPDTGFDSIGDYPQGPGLSRFLGTLAQRGALPKTVLYNLNPADNYLFATMIGNFQGATAGSANAVPGRMQLGSGWWFLDQNEGMTMQMRALMNLGLFSRFIGMLTDSRSFLSYPRHEYFRRLLCSILGSDVQAGEMPDDRELLGAMVENICFNNARDYFGIALHERYA